MNFTDLFVRRPVLASVVSLLILVVGLRAYTLLEVRQYPETQNTVVTVTTIYPGADAELVAGFITTPLQQAIAEAEGIDYLSSSSGQGISVIEAHMVLNYDAKDALSEIQAKVASQRRVLPEEAEDPVIDATTGDPTALMYLAFFSDRMSPSEITDYLSRVVQPKLQALPGVATARPIGNQSFALRVWLDPLRMAALGVTAEEVAAALRANNFLAAPGRAEGRFVALDLGATTDLSRARDFRELVVREHGGTLIRLQELAEIEMGAEDYDSVSWYKGKTAVFIGVEQAPGANPLAVAARVHEALPEIRAGLPTGLEVRLPYDASVFIEDSIREVFTTLGEAVLIVLAVIYLSLGSLRAALVPAVAVPLSLIGAGLLMLWLDFSVNLLTLLAMVLAIGLVVDDAIVVVENVHRHIEQGEPPLAAALVGARELALPIIAMTTTLLAVYAPVGFMGGLVGTLFTEFAFALAGAVLVSGVVALTLSPMLCARLLPPPGAQAGRFARGSERFFQALAEGYRRLLHRSLDHRPLTYAFSLLVLAGIGFMYGNARSELAPTEDQSILFFSATAPQTATLDYDALFTRQIVEHFESFPEYEESFLLLGFGGTDRVFGGFKMGPPRTRERSQMLIAPQLQERLNGVAGFEIAVFPRPSLPTPGRGLPLQFVITGDAGFEALDQVADRMVEAALASGRLTFLRKSIQYARPRAVFAIRRDSAGDLGIDMAAVARTLSTLLGENEVNRFSLEGRSYKVIPQVAADFRAHPRQAQDFYLRAAGGALVPLGALFDLQQRVEPSARTQFQQLNSLTLEGLMAPGVSLGEALAVLRAQAAGILPKGFGWDTTGESRQFLQQGAALELTFFLSLLVIYLVLAAQFESWRDPLIILVSVPLSVAGALVFIALDLATVNIYTQVGLITLIGLVAKNGILIVEFANRLRDGEGLALREAVEQAAAIRLRPVLMTTVSMVVAMVPLLLATGPGAVSRFHIGLIIAAGLGLGTLFTLFVVPAVYVLLASRARGAPGQGL